MFKKLNLGVKRLIWCFWGLASIVLFSMAVYSVLMFETQKEWVNGREEWVNRNGNIHNEDFIGYNQHLSNMHTKSEIYIGSLVGFQVVYWGLIYLFLWIRQGFKTKSTA